MTSLWVWLAVTLAAAFLTIASMVVLEVWVARVGRGRR